MMNPAWITWLCFVCFLSRVNALKCMKCDGFSSFDDCDARGQAQKCMANQSCETVVRRQGEKMLVWKGCKDTVACGGNQMQNNIYSGRSTQCNSDQANSVCTCCCSTSMCNTGFPNCMSKHQPQSDAVKDCAVVPSSFPHGNVKCNKGNIAGSVCEYKCTEKDYSVWPKERNINVCLSNGTWAHKKPCCARPCPPYFLQDNAMLTHFTGKSGDRFLQSMPDAMIYGVITEDSVKITAMSYGKEPIESSVVKFNEYGANSTLLRQMLEDRLTTSDGPGNTGLAIQYALDNLLTAEAGMRTNSGVGKTLEIATNVQPSDNAIAAAERARQRGILVYVFAFEIDGFKFDQEQLLRITGDKKHVFVFQGYYDQLKPEQLQDVDDHFCMDPCDHVLHDE